MTTDQESELNQEIIDAVRFRKVNEITTSWCLWHQCGSPVPKTPFLNRICILEDIGVLVRTKHIGLTLAEGW